MSRTVIVLPTSPSRSVASALNKIPVGTYRGAGQPEVAFPVECLLDVLAKQIGLGAAELRARNLVRPQDMPYATGTALFGKGLSTRTPTFHLRWQPRSTQADTLRRSRLRTTATALPMASAAGWRPADSSISNRRGCASMATAAWS